MDLNLAMLFMMINSLLYFYDWDHKVCLAFIYVAFLSSIDDT